MERRKGQDCRTFDVKIDASHLNETQKRQLKMLFVEAKWFYNHVVEWTQEHDIFDFSTTGCKDVVKLDMDGNRETVPLEFLTSSLKQTILKRMQASVKAMDTLQERGYQQNDGTLKFKSEVNSLVYRQYKVTHNIKNGTRVHLQGVSGYMRVNGTGRAESRWRRRCDGQSRSK